MKSVVSVRSKPPSTSLIATHLARSSSGLHRAAPLRALLVALVLSGATDAPAHELEEVEVVGRRINLVGGAISASEGIVGQQELRIRPMLRSGDVLELVPGMVVTQHSGTGKANQYFLRGFNLDHGTDFATWVDDMPVNMRTHGHGQGYTDLNFIIVETIGQLEYSKGSHYTRHGDFSSVGAAEMQLAERWDKGRLELSLGENHYARALALGSAELAEGDLAYAFEANSYDGPWTDIDEDVKKLNLLLKFSRDLAGGRFAVSFMGYDNSWNSADQIPQRAVEQGIIDELGSLDDTVGGESSRYSLSASWRGQALEFSAYAIDSKLDLWSNFTYFLDNPVTGDQFQQVDDRQLFGGKARYQLGDASAPGGVAHRFGAEVRYDRIDEVGLYQSRARQPRGVVRSDEVDETSWGLYYENEWRWNHHFRSIIGARYDAFQFDVDSRVAENANGVDLTVNGGDRSDGVSSLNASVIYTIDENWETYASLGQGFHSNDARGATIRVDPIDGSPVDRVDPLVQSWGGELGGRAFWSDKLNASAALWYLELDSELLFVGDAGNTEASRASERVGLELTSYIYLSENWVVDFEYAWTDARYSEGDPREDHIPGSVEQVLQAGLSLDNETGWFGSLRLRYFGERPLTEDGSVKSDSTTSVNLRLGYRWPSSSLQLDTYNLFDSDDHDIDYLYSSRLPGEPAGGIEDIHYHVLEPRTLRLSVSWFY